MLISLHSPVTFLNTTPVGDKNNAFCKSSVKIIVHIRKQRVKQTSKPMQGFEALLDRELKINNNCLFFFGDRVSLCHPGAGVQWRDLIVLQPPPPGFQ